jgi:glucosamine-6-phosphate deaminase
MHIVIFPSARRAATGVAQFVARALRAQPDLVLGLPTGRTMVPVYEELVRLHQRGRADFRRSTTFNLDEFIGLGPAHPGSYRMFMRRLLFDAVNIPPAARHFPRSTADGGRRYDRQIGRAGGLDLCVLGIGMNGHLGFNEPAPGLAPGTHRVRLTAASRRANAYLFSGQVSAVPRTAMSMGIGTIMNARALVLIATGSEKAAIVRRAIAGPVTTRIPASLIQTHPNALVVLDRDAAARLSSR